MKIIIEHWGPVERCEFDLDKSLIVVYGNNNIGKSYAMQALYLLLKNLIAYANALVQFSYGIIFYFEGPSKTSPETERLVVDFAQSGESERYVTEELVGIAARNMEKALLPELGSSFINSFGTYDNMLQRNPVFILQMEDIVLRIYLNENRIELQQKVKTIRLKTSESDFHKHREDKRSYTIYVYKNKINTPNELLERKVEEIQKMFAARVLKKVQHVYFLPASRSGIYAGMSSFGPILAQLSQNRNLAKGKFQIPSISEPISDYYMALSTIKAKESDDFQECVDEIEKEILKGNVTFDSKRKTIMYHPVGTELNLEMSDVSSMVSEISPITAFLKYIIRGTKSSLKSRYVDRSIVFIEEPEAHLHPSNQIALIKSFAKLSKGNVQLIMASHSNYIFNQLNNMVMSKELDEQTYLPILMLEKDGASRSEYMIMDEFGVDDDNFADVAEKLLQERDDLIAAMLEKAGEGYDGE